MAGWNQSKMSYEYVYLIEPKDYSVVKIGRWSGTISDLRTRYATYYPDFDMTVFQCKDSTYVEKNLHRDCADHLRTRELFHPSVIERFFSLASALCDNCCKSRDLTDKIARLALKRAQATQRENDRLRKENIQLRAKCQSDPQTDSTSGQLGEPARKQGAPNKISEHVKVTLADKKTKQLELQLEIKKLHAEVTKGSATPVESRKVTDQLHNEFGVFKEFIECHYEVSQNEKDRIGRSAVHDTFRTWCKKQNRTDLLRQPAESLQRLKIEMFSSGFVLDEYILNGKLRTKSKRVHGEKSPISAFSFIRLRKS